MPPKDKQETDPIEANRAEQEAAVKEALAETVEVELFNPNDGIHHESRHGYGGPYLDEVENEAWQKRHGPGTTSPGTTLVTKQALIQNFNPTNLAGDEFLKNTDIDVKPVVKIDVPVGSEGLSLGPDITRPLTEENRRALAEGQKANK